MGIESPEMITLNKSRKRAIYMRPDGKGGYIHTSLLPADPASINYYFMKGFKAPPKVEVKSEEVVKTSSSEEPKKAEMVDGKLVITCPLCSFTTQSAFGLQAHLRKHVNESNKEETKSE